MRPISEKQSFLRNPLNYILGTEAQVRILRVLSQTQNPLSGSEIASQCDLTFRGASKALESLVGVEIVSYIGRERSKLYILFNEHPLAPLLKRLFKNESDIYPAFLEDAKGLFDQIKSKPTCAWIEGDLANNNDIPGSVIRLRFLAGSSEIEVIEKSIVDLVGKLEKKFLVDIELTSMTKADLIADHQLKHLNDMKFIGLYGPSPLVYIADPAKKKRQIPKRHQDIDDRNLSIAEELVAAIKENHSFIHEALKYLNKRLKIASRQEANELEEWKRILENSTPIKVCRILTGSSERSKRLRQSIPFVGILKTEKRK